MQQEAPTTQAPTPTPWAEPARAAEYRVAMLPKEDVEKLQHLEQELAADLGEEIVLVAYGKQA
ncbi:MAG: hypothetical protein HY320_15740 [Armatimonadetes bacterium]|nr:hypothetical protein [Armatimonadota bacterium]